MTVAARSEESIFAAALERPGAEARAAFLAEACGDDVELRCRVEALLESHEAKGFLEQPPAAPGPTVDWPPADRPESVGPYRLLERIGEGGMGEVWLAEQQEPVRRRVALKLVRAGMDSKA